MFDYSNVIFDMVNYCGGGIVVFLLLSLILDYLRTMLFNNK